MFDGYETYALVLVAAPAVRQLVAADQRASLPLYIGGLLSVTLVGWATGGVSRAFSRTMWVASSC